MPESAVLENPFWPVSVHAVALLLLHVSFVDVSLRTRIGSAESVTVGRHRESEGLAALQVPLHVIVPLLVWPHTFALEVHGFPYVAGTGGTVAEQLQLELYVPVA